MYKFALWARERTASTGTGDITLSGALPGFATFSSQLAANDTVIYSIHDGDSRELGVGTLISNTVLERTTVKATLQGGVFSAGGGKLNLSGNAIVACSDSAELLTWASGIRESTGHTGEVLVVEGTGLAALSGVVDGGVVP
jgi:hypothetical protein